MKNDQYLRKMYFENIIRTHTSTRNFTGTKQIALKSRELLFEHLWIYYILSNDKENTPNTFVGVSFELNNTVNQE